MIQVTLTFTSIAAAVAALRGIDAEASYQADDAARTALQDARSGNAGKKETLATTPARNEASGVNEAAKNATTAAGPAAAAAPASTPKPAAAAATTESAALSYEADVKPLVIKAGAAKGREAVAALFAALGVTKGPELKADQLADAKARFETLIAAA